MPWKLTTYRTLGPWEPEWIKLVRHMYYANRSQELLWRIGSTDSGRAFLARTGAYGQEAEAAEKLHPRG